MAGIGSQVSNVSGRTNGWYMDVSYHLQSKQWDSGQRWAQVKSSWRGLIPSHQSHTRPILLRLFPSSLHNDLWVGTTMLRNWCFYIWMWKCHIFYKYKFCAQTEQPRNHFSHLLTHTDPLVSAKLVPIRRLSLRPYINPRAYACLDITWSGPHVIVI